ncbi:sodium:solute symporter family protein [Candidatus Babeliales bacterium]|nr:sodium:solute symporter family protein [Candidatus Babeliales bacterium]
MNITLFLSVFSILAIVYLIIGIGASRKIKTNEDYFLAGRNLGFWPLVATLLATHIGGGMMFGTAKEAYNVGCYGILYSLGLALGLIVLGFGFASKLRVFNVATTVELFEVKYNSVFLRKFASILSAVSLCGILAGIVISAREFFLGLGLQSELAFIIFWLFVIFYTVIGGLKAVIATDVFQVIFIIILFFGVFIFSLFQDWGTVASNMQLFPISEGYFSFGRLARNLLIPFLFVFIEQDIAQRFFAARNKKIAVTSALFSGIFLILFSFIPVYFGINAKVLNMIVPLGASPLVILLQQFVGDFVFVLIMCALFAAIVSTADSLLCAISSNIAQDFEFSWLRIKNKLRFSQLITFLTGIFSLGVAYFFDSIIEVIVASYTLLVCSLFVSVMFCFFKDKLDKEAAFGSVFAGLLGFIYFKLFPVINIPEFVLALGLSLIGYFVGTGIARYYRQTT